MKDLMKGVFESQEAAVEAVQESQGHPLKVSGERGNGDKVLSCPSSGKEWYVTGDGMVFEAVEDLPLSKAQLNLAVDTMPFEPSIAEEIGPALRRSYQRAKEMGLEDLVNKADFWSYMRSELTAVMEPRANRAILRAAGSHGLTLDKGQLGRGARRLAKAYTFRWERLMRHTTAGEFNLLRDVRGPELENRAAALFSKGRVERIAQNEAGQLRDLGNQLAYQLAGVTHEVWKALGTADAICKEFDGFTYEVEKGPRPIRDTHIGCRCERLPVKTSRDVAKALTSGDATLWVDKVGELDDLTSPRLENEKDITGEPHGHELKKQPRPGLVPQSGDPEHPVRWVRPEDAQRGQPRGGRPEREGELIRQNFAQFLSERGIPDPGLEHGMLGSGGRMSARAERAAKERLGSEFAEYAEAQKEYQGLINEGKIVDPLGRFKPMESKDTSAEEVERLESRVRELRGLAERGMSPRKFTREADRLEAEASALRGDVRKQRAGAGRDLHPSDPSDVEAVEMYKQPPGGPPRPGLIWSPSSHRWVREETMKPALGVHGRTTSDLQQIHPFLERDAQRHPDPKRAAASQRVLRQVEEELTRRGTSARGSIDVLRAEKDIPWIDEEEEDTEEAIHALKDITGAGNTLAGVSVHDNTFGGQRRRARRGNSIRSTKLLKSFDRYLLRLGDSGQALKELPAESVDCAVTSPSYWGPKMQVKDGDLGKGSVRGYINTLRGAFGQLRRAMKPTGSLWLVLGNGGHEDKSLNVPVLVAKALVKDGWYLQRSYIWDKGDTCDSVFHLTIQKGEFFPRQGFKLPDTWRFTLKDRHQPGSQFGAFPVELCEQVIKATCPADGLVVDPFVGTGTAVIAGLNTGRRVIGIDLSQRELTVARERVTRYCEQAQIVRPIKLMKQLMHGVARYDLHVISKQAGGEGRFVVAGYASPVLVDQEGHRITREALAGDLPRFMADGGKYANVNILHSNVTIGKVIPTFKDASGRTLTTKVDDRGLFVVAELRTDPAAPEIVHKVIEDIENGTLKSFSISGNAENPVFTCDGDRCFYDINELELYEITICEEGVNQEAKFSVVSKGAEARVRGRA